jgi:cysteinyl-tRNA synthetase
MAFRYMMLLGHYRSPIEFSWASLDAATVSYKNIIKKVASIITDAKGQVSNSNAADEWHNKMLISVSDNLKTATAIVDFQEMLKEENLTAGEKLGLVQFVDELLGLQFIARAEKLLAEEATPIPADVQKLADDRTAAKAAKDWALADQIRDQVEDMGWLIQDSKEGMKIVKK